MENKIFGRLTVVKYLGTRRYANRPHGFWLCRCECGKEIEKHTSALTSGNTKSCGCFRKNNPGRSKTHGMSKSPTRKSWVGMKRRCYNLSYSRYDRYGGRGIQVCDRWRYSFINFLEDMGKRPEGKTLDRWPDPDGNYEPGNCRWATPKQQRANRGKT